MTPSGRGLRPPYPLLQVLTGLAIAWAAGGAWAADGAVRGPIPLAAGGPARATSQERREILSLSAEQALARLGRTGGFSADPRVRIGMPPALRDTEKLLRRLGGNKEADAFILAMNQTAEAMLAKAAPLVMAAVRETGDSGPETAAGGMPALAGTFRRLHGDALQSQLIPIARELTDGQLIARVYKRVVKQSTRFGFLRGEAPKLEDYLAQQTLNGLISAMAEAERVIQAKRAGLGVAARPGAADNERIRS